MAESIELKFCGKLQKYKKCQKYLIPKDIYYKTIEDILRLQVSHQKQNFCLKTH